MTLTAEDFPALYRHVHGHEPFAWQRDLVHRVLESGRWPDLVDVPTGLGKTSLVDVAVFVAGATARRKGAERVGRRRCFLVVDRRIVVDEATAHARRLADALTEAEHRGGTDPEDVPARLAAALRSYAPDTTGDVLPVTRMRGGVAWSSTWTQRPDRPGIVLGTVDQIGSRLLFRGYGVSDRRRSLEAAFVGTDSLILVDEAHLARSLSTTVSAALERDRLGLPLPGPHALHLTATGEPTGESFTLDVEAHRDDPEAWRRLTAPKRLIPVRTKRSDCPRALAALALGLVGDLRGRTGTSDASGRTPWAPTVLIVCNTVDRARAVFEQLQRGVAAPGPRHVSTVPEIDLLIGRSRPVDRAGLTARIIARYGSGRAPADRAAVLVATQTVEVGVNLDVDALVTETASWDALVQRLGRLNRLGRYGERFPGAPAAVAVVVHDDRVDGPVYGRSRDDTWERLIDRVPVTADVRAAATGQVPALGVSPLECRELSATDLGRGTPEGAGTPLLQVPTLDAWTRTGPVPLADPPVDVFLHGFATGTPDVHLTWRSGLLSDDPLDDPFDDAGNECPQAVADALLTAMPPRPAEQVPVPFCAVRQWAGGEGTGPVGDTESALPQAQDRTREHEREPFRLLVRRAGGPGDGTDERWRWTEPDRLRPGDHVVVPVERGGLDRYGWNPSCTDPVPDMFETATFIPTRSGRDRSALRLDTGLPERLGLAGRAADGVREIIRHSFGPRPADPPAPEDVEDLLTTLDRALLESAEGERGVPDPSREGAHVACPDPRTVAAWLHTGPRIVEVPDPRGPYRAGEEPDVLVLLLAAGHPPEPDRPGGEPAAVGEGNTRRIPLEHHLESVRDRAVRIARALALPGELVAVVEDAARWHDLGKVEDRFQVMLHGGDVHEALLADAPAAKSGVPDGDPQTRRTALRLSGLPAGARHEAWSAALVGRIPRQDTDLLVHLVASHHGHARPLLPPVVDPDPRPISADLDGHTITVSSQDTVCLDHPSRFARLNARYGRWGLALLEAVVRCADTTVSAEET